MRKFILSILLFALPIIASAYDAEIDGIYYNLIPEKNEAEVTYREKYYTPYSGSVTIPESFTYEGVEYSVTSIGYAAFYNCSGLTSVTIPNSVNSIGDLAFCQCGGLTSVTIPNPVTSIGDGAFANCSSLSLVTISNSVTSIGNGSFANCSSLTSVTIPNSVTNIGERAFSDCSSLTSVNIPNSVTSIGERAFEYCRSLTSVVIPNSVTNIGDGVFFSCNGLTSVTIPNSVTNIGDFAFSYCSSLTSVTIPNSVISIGNTAFSRCTSLASVIIPNSVTSIGSGAFSGCSSLISVTIPNSVTSIGDFAFTNCSGLTSVVIPNSVTYIGERAFSYCIGLISVTIGSSIRDVNSWAFEECSKLEEVYCLAKNVPNTKTTAFEKSYPENTTLYVPAESLNAYKTTFPRSLFGTIKAINGTGDELTKCATPIISYADKELTFSCETEGVEFVSEIKDVDVNKFYDSRISLAATYEISVYATKSGYENSDIATATLVWTDAIFTETTETSTSAKAVTESIPVLISANNGTITVRGDQNGPPFAVYTIDGKLLGSATISNGQASVATGLQSGQVAIVKVGGRSVKVRL